MSNFTLEQLQELPIPEPIRRVSSLHDDECMICWRSENEIFEIENKTDNQDNIWDINICERKCKICKYCMISYIEQRVNLKINKLGTDRNCDTIEMRCPGCMELLLNKSWKNIISEQIKTSLMQAYENSLMTFCINCNLDVHFRVNDIANDELKNATKSLGKYLKDIYHFPKKKIMKFMNSCKEYCLNEMTATELLDELCLLCDNSEENIINLMNFGWPKSSSSSSSSSSSTTTTTTVTTNTISEYYRLPQLIVAKIKRYDFQLAFLNRFGHSITCPTCYAPLIFGAQGLINDIQYMDDHPYEGDEY